MRIVLAGWIVAIASCQPQTGPVASVAVPESFGAVPAFSFTERSGKTVTNDDLKGKVWVASFVFTRCTGSCPQVAATMAKLQDDYKVKPGVKFVTFTIDPERDKLEDLKTYAQKYGADPERWLFLTGPEAKMHEFATKGFKLLATKRAEPKPGDEFDHSSKIVVVDQGGGIRGYFDGMADTKFEGGQAIFDAAQKKLRDTIDALAK